MSAAGDGADACQRCLDRGWDGCEDCGPCPECGGGGHIAMGALVFHCSRCKATGRVKKTARKVYE